MCLTSWQEMSEGTKYWDMGTLLMGVDSGGLILNNPTGGGDVALVKVVFYI